MAGAGLRTGASLRIGGRVCSAYWNLEAQVSCRKCGHVYTDDLQTHFMGEWGSCENYYEIDEPVEELKGVSVILNGENDDFISICPECKEAGDFGAEIVQGKVVRVWSLPSRDVRSYE